MPSASAKAKYQAVLDDPMRRQSSSHLKNREMITRIPSGGSEVTNSVTRRPSSSSQTGPDKQPIRSAIKNWLKLPAF
ncbi:hypothetical protein F5X68DRAFT_237415 [Plectosphaerella plurivora]|uniref:Uncharacterized protein n=1 Tax=Plectosphaerella plurivora TaxID=936078 RepID=A0A9P9A598_9PEZI|nr:hypothetical protein F5X68DRAFT_237415 [Plectosphaerella plurivora]